MDKWKNYRANNVVPPGFKAVPEVFEILGRVIFDPDRWGDDCIDQWNGRECDPLATLTEAERSRRKEALLWMHKLSSAGVLRFFMLRSGGVPALVSKERWNCAGEVAEDRFLACALYSGRGSLMQRPTELVDRADYYRRFDIPIFADDVSLMTAAKGLVVEPYGAGRSATDDMSIHIADSFLARFKAEISAEGQDGNMEVAASRSIHTGNAGRPTPWGMIQEMFDSRCAAGTVCGAKAEEARELVRLYESDPLNADLPRIKVGTVKDRLTKPYAHYKASLTTGGDPQIGTK